MPRLCVGVACLLTITLASLAKPSNGQTAPQSTSSPQAVTLAVQSMAALLNGATISDVAITGSVTTTIGPDTQSATGTFSANASGGSRVDLNYGNGKTSELRDVENGSPFGEFIAQDGTQQIFAGQNCLTDAAWFFPALTVLGASADPIVTFSYIGLEQHMGAAVHHLSAYRSTSAIAMQWGLPQGSILPPQLSTTDLYLDTTTLLPVAIAFYRHPDNDWNTNIAVEIDFSTYQVVNGINVPLHIQKLLQGGLALDLVVTSVALNSGIPNSTFQIF